MLTDKDKAILKARNISEDTLLEQVSRFKTGFPVLRLAGSATVGNGITRMDAEAEAEAIGRWDKYLADGGSVTKFVPASGAASRMFKALYAFVNGDSDVPAPDGDVDRIIKSIDRLPFREELDATLVRLTGKTAAGLIADNRYKEVISAIVNPEGLNYGNLPKGLLSFHRYGAGDVHTPVEEQMTEGAQTAASNGRVNLHFTVSDAHKDLFLKKIAEVQPRLEDKYGVKYHISLSEQKPSTDTVAVNPDNTLFRDGDGNLVFRPGGHGALIENLGDIDSTVVFIKNIDNVVPDGERESTLRYKKILAGKLLLVHDRIEDYVRKIDAGKTDRRQLDEMLRFLEDELCTRSEGAGEMDDKSLRDYLRAKFDRPVRVCGMVVNEGEPGGGPYIAYNSDGSCSPQILESTQIDLTNPASAEMMSKATHFNPVDLVCYIRDIDGRPYDLRRYVDDNTGFISQKSAGGRELRALELPGLWNGAMSDWNTVFVEVPASTFNPVKTVNDLLRPVHQADKNL